MLLITRIPNHFDSEIFSIQTALAITDSSSMTAHMTDRSCHTAPVLQRITVVSVDGTSHRQNQNRWTAVSVVSTSCLNALASVSIASNVS